MSTLRSTITASSAASDEVLPASVGPRPARTATGAKRRLREVGEHLQLAVVAPVPRIALTQQEACAALGCSEEFFVEHIRPRMRVVRRGKKRLFPVDELRRVIDEMAENVM